MIQILGANDGVSNEETVDKELFSQEARRHASLLSRLDVRRLVLQPMDARLEYMRDLRVWLRENGWRITQVGVCLVVGRYVKGASEGVDSSP